MIKKTLILLISFTFLFIEACAPSLHNELSKDSDGLKPPVAKILPVQKNYTGDVYNDNYFWLRDKTNPEVINYLKEENNYTDIKMKHTENLQDKLYKEMVGRIKEEDSSVPEKRDSYYYYYRTEPGKQYRIYCRKRLFLTANEEIILDANELAKGLDYFELGALRISPNHRYLAYEADTNGSENYTLYIKDLNTGALLPEKIPETYTYIEWSNDNEYLFYTVIDSTNRPFKALRHKIGTDPKNDSVVYNEPDEAYYLSLSKTKDKYYILFNSSSQITSETRYLYAVKPLNNPKIFANRKYGVEYSVDHSENKFFILTNEDAPNFKIMVAPEINPERKNWKEIIPQWDNVKLDEIQLFRKFMVIAERENAIKKILVINMDNLDMNFIDFKEPVFNIQLERNPDYNSNILRFSYESFTTPLSVYDYNMMTRNRELMKQKEVLGGFDSNKYTSERVYAPSHDGVMVPVSLVYKKDMLKNGNNPLFLYAYGSYGVNSDIDFDSSRFSLIDRGFIFAIAHIRGGGDLGRKWYDDGKFLKKINTFKDFIASGEYLIKEKYTSKEKLVISGGSAGGLLMGAVTNMRPDLFKAVIAEVPFVDVINTMMDPSLPLTVIEYDEWGNPNIKEYYDYMKSYSPYDNVQAEEYPNMLVTGGLNDPRVGFWEPAKYVAKLRTMKKDNNILLLKINMGAGHGGASGRYDYLKDIAFQFSFFLDILGIRE